MIELVDDEYRPVPPGETGTKLLVTPLFNRTQPLIRYELDDGLKLSRDTGQCGLPFRAIEEIQGHRTDAIRLPATSGGEVEIQPVLFNQVLDVLPISGWQVIQDDSGLSILLCDPRVNLPERELVDRIAQAITRLGARIPPIQVRSVSMIPKNAGGKAPLIVSIRSEK